MTLREGKERRDVLVHAAHEASLVSWHERVASETQRFVTVLAFTPLVLLVAVGIAALASRASTFVVLGLALIALAAFRWAHPYATPQTMRLVGVRRSITLVRIMTVVVLGGALALVVGRVGAAYLT